MRIAIYDPYLDALGGGEKYMMTAAQCLSKNHDVSILWDNEQDIERVEDRFNLDLSKAKIEKNIFSSTVSLPERLQRSRAYDVIFYLSDGSIPVVLTKKLILHLQFPVEWINMNVKNKLKMKRVHTVICNSEFTKKFIDKKFGVSSKIVYPPVAVKKGDSKKENIVLHVGRFMKTGVEGTDYKKQYFMIDTFKKLVDTGLTGWKFVIAASVRTNDLADFQKMQATAAGYPISFIVNATNDDLWKEYNKAKIYWHASGIGEDIRKHPERAEHFGISTVEAMGAGAVPVVINAGGQKEIVVDGKNGVLWNSQEELQEMTLMVMNHPAMLQELSNQAQKDARKYSQDEFCEKINRIFTE